MSLSVIGAAHLARSGIGFDHEHVDHTGMIATPYAA